MGIKNILISEAQPGMVVASSVCDNAGRVIIPVGGRLTPMALKRLPRWGITGVSVEVEDSQGHDSTESVASTDSTVSSDEEELAFAARITQMVNERFSTIDSTHFNDEYRKIVVKYLIEKGKNVVPGL